MSQEPIEIPPPPPPGTKVSAAKHFYGSPAKLAASAHDVGIWDLYYTSVTARLALGWDVRDEPRDGDGLNPLTVESPPYFMRSTGQVKTRKLLVVPFRRISDLMAGQQVPVGHSHCRVALLRLEAIRMLLLMSARPTTRIEIFLCDHWQGRAYPFPPEKESLP